MICETKGLFDVVPSQWRNRRESTLYGILEVRTLWNTLESDERGWFVGRLEKGQCEARGLKDIAACLGSATRSRI